MNTINIDKLESYEKLEAQLNSSLLKSQIK